MSDSVIFVQFRPTSWYELRSFGTTLDALGRFYWRNNRWEVNYNRTCYRKNGLAELLKWRSVHAPLSELWDRRGRIKRLVVPSGATNVSIDMRPTHGIQQLHTEATGLLRASR